MAVFGDDLIRFVVKPDNCETTWRVGLKYPFPFSMRPMHVIYLGMPVQLESIVSLRCANRV